MPIVWGYREGKESVMLIVGERLSIISKKVREAMMTRDPKHLQELAKRQVEGGASMIDISIGPAEEGGGALMDWAVKTVQEVVQIPLCLDTTNPSALKAGLKAHNNRWGRPLINSASGEPERLNAMMSLAAEHNACIIGLTLKGVGIPPDAEGRCAIAAEIMEKALELGVSLEDIYLDPLILPVSSSQEQAMEAIRAIRLFQQINDPPMKTIVGLSNISNGCPKELRGIINRTFLTVLMYEGLTAAIADSMDKDFMDTLKTTEILLGKTLYAHSYLEV